jgi:hypothetical protein
VGELTSIDVSEVYRIGDATRDVAGRLERLAAGIETWEYAAKGAIDGAVTCETGAAEAARHWETTLERLGQEVRGFADEMRQAATDYRETDAAAYRLVREAGEPPR